MPFQLRCQAFFQLQYQEFLTKAKGQHLSADENEGSHLSFGRANPNMKERG